nr:uncharacterized protein LOC129440481 isoform X3 [Misgurnus anguillicaudatus]
MMSGPQSVVRRFWVQWQQMINCLWFISIPPYTVLLWPYQKIVDIIKIVQVQWQQMINCLWFISIPPYTVLLWPYQKIVDIIKIVQIQCQQMINCLWFIFGIARDIVLWPFQKIVGIIKTCAWYLFNGINKAKRNNYYIIQSGNSCNAHTRILKNLHEHVPGMTEVNKVEKCDVILVFCPIVSRAGTDIQAALDQLNNCSESKPAVFMLLHHTFDREKVLPDSSRFITRGNTLTVNCLFNEDEGLLACDMNDVELDKIIQHLKPQQRINCLWFIISIARGIVLWPYQKIVCIIKKVQIQWQQRINCLWFIFGIPRYIVVLIKIVQTLTWYLFNGINKAKRNKYYIIQSGNSCNAHTRILKNLHEHVPGMTEVNKVEKCDVLLVFCPIVSRAGTDIQAALDQLNNCSESKPAVFMVLHHTFDREKVLPDSSSFITRRKTLTVNLLFHEDVGLHKCYRNDEAQAKTIQHLKHQIQFKKRFRAIMLFIAVTTVYCVLRGIQIVYEFRGRLDQTSAGAKNA